MATARTGSRQDIINKTTPGTAKAKLGDIVAELTAQVNALTTAHNAMAAKLDADAGVTDTTYVSLTGVTATAIVSMENR